MSDRYDTSLIDAPPLSVDPADANMSWHWIRTVLSKIGLSVVVVEAEKPDFAQESWATLGEILSKKLAELGELDSVKWEPPIRWFFLVSTRRLGSGLQAIRSELETLQLLPHVRIGHADGEAGVWRTFHPGMDAKP